MQRNLKTTLWSICLVALSINFRVYGQSEPNSIIKIGGFIYFLDGKYNGGSLHLEYEIKFRKSNILTSGPRLDYINHETSYGSTTLGYQFKLYPLYKVFKGKQLEGIFVGIDPLYRMKNPDRTYSKYGPGVGIILGYQKILKKRFSVSFEASTITMKDLNEKSNQTNPDDIYMYAFACIKGGIKIK